MVAIVGDVVEKGLLGIKEEVEEAREVDLEYRMEDEAVTALLYPPPLPAPRATCLAIFRSTCAIEWVSGSGVAPREICIGTCMWGVNCCNKSARSTPNTRPVSSDRAATDMDDVIGMLVLQS